jgi:hypothetical protein
MKQFIGGLIGGIGIGLLICGLIASSMVSDFEYTLNKYDRQIDDFYELTHSYGFETVQDLVTQTADFYRANPLIRQALETVGMGQVGQLLQDVDGNFQEIIDMSEDLYEAKSSVKEARSSILYLEIGGIILIIISIVAAVWVSRSNHTNR